MVGEGTEWDEILRIISPKLTWKISNVEQYSLKIKYHDLVIENIGKYIPALDPQTFKEEKLKSGIFCEQ